MKRGQIVRLVLELYAVYSLFCAYHVYINQSAAIDSINHRAETTHQHLVTVTNVTVPIPMQTSSRTGLIHTVNKTSALTALSSPLSAPVLEIRDFKRKWGVLKSSRLQWTLRKEEDLVKSVVINLCMQLTIAYGILVWQLTCIR